MDFVFLSLKNYRIKQPIEYISLGCLHWSAYFSAHTIAYEDMMLQASGKAIQTIITGISSS